MRKLLPVIMLLIGTGAGIGAGLFTQTVEEETAELKDCVPLTDDTSNTAEIPAEYPDQATAENTEYVKLNNQFIVPVLKEGKVTSLVVLSLSLEVAEGSRDEIFRHEPKLRDVFLSVLFEHANAGGFDGAFTSNYRMVVLRDALLETARLTLGTIVTDILIQDINRQDA